MDRDTILKAIKRVAQEKGVEQLSRKQFTAAAGISDWHIYQHFDGWREACEAAGLKPHTQNVRLEDDVLFEEMHRVFVVCGEICTAMKFDRLAQYGVSTYKNRFGKWPDVLLKFKHWIEQKHIDFPFVDKLSSAAVVQLDKDQTAIAASDNRDRAQWKSIGGSVYGPFLNFRGRQHAPVNEQGVVIGRST